MFRIMEVTTLFTLLFALLVQAGAAQKEGCILGNWYDIGSVPNAQLIFRIQQSKDDPSSQVALALTPNPQWATGRVSYNVTTQSIAVQLDSLDMIKGTVDCTNNRINWSTPSGATWIKVPPVQNVHLVFMNHLDVGYARFIGDIINEYFDTYFPRAVALGSAAQTWRNGSNGFIYTTHPWLVNLYLDCPPNLVFNGIPVHCPTKDAISAFENAISKGHIAWHAGPMNMQVEFLDNVILTAGLMIADDLNARFNKPPSLVLSQRDVPGLTVAAVPVFTKHGIKGVSVGVNPGSAPPAVPKIFSWQYNNESIVGMWHAGGYPLDPGSNLQSAGGISIRDCTIAPSTTHALCFAFRTDNTGPPTSLEELDKYYEILSEEFPEANVFASTMDNFVSNVNTSSLPVVSDKEIGDNWIQGIASDPLKSSQYRAAASGLSDCVQANDCKLNDPIVFNTTRFLLKLPEHTWGLPGIHDDVNWNNVDFEKARMKGGTYADNENSWKEQRTFLDIALESCKGHNLSTYILNSMADVVPFLPDIREFKEIDPSAIKIMNGEITLGFNKTIGSMNALAYKTSSGENMELVTNQNQLGVFTYHTYNESDFQFMNAHYDYYGNAGYDKPGSTANAHPESRTWPVKLVKAYQSKLNEASFLMHMMMANETTHTKYGAPSDIWVTITLSYIPNPNFLLKLDYDMIITGKIPTRLPEATMFSFYPNPPTALGWTGYLGKINDDGSTEINVGSVVKNGSQYQHAVQYVKLATPTPVDRQDKDANGKYTVTMNSKHIPLVCPITGDGRTPTPFPAPLDPIPEGRVTGMAFNIHNNIWNTNYPLYYPYVAIDNNIRAKFSVVYKSS